MGDRPTSLSTDEIQVLASKLNQFREDLGPREQTAFDYLMAQARQSVADVQGFENGPGSDIHEPNFNWLGSLANQPLVPGSSTGPFNVSEHRQNG